MNKIISIKYLCICGNENLEDVSNLMSFPIHIMFCGLCGYQMKSEIIKGKIEMKYRMGLA